MLSRRRISLRLTLALCCLLLLAAQTHPSAAQSDNPVIPKETVLLPPGSFPHFATANYVIDGGLLYWIDPENNIAGIDISTRQRRTLAPAGERSYSLAVRGDHAVWMQAEDDQFEQQWLRGLRLSDGMSFTINEGLEQITDYTLSNGRIVWARRVGEDTRIMLQTLPPQGKPRLLVEVRSGHAGSLSLNGSELTWTETYEAAPGSGQRSAQIRAVDVEAGGAPTTLATSDRPISRFIRTPTTLVWSVRKEKAGPSSDLVFRLDPLGKPVLINNDAVRFTQLEQHLVILTSQGVLRYDLLHNTSTTISSQKPRDIAVAMDENTICWGDSTPPLPLYCYSHSHDMVFESPMPGALFSLHISDKTLVLATHVAGHSDPITVFSLPLADLYRRAKPLAHNPRPADLQILDRLWERQDLPVQRGGAARSWTWGPRPLGPELREPYAEGAGGTRLVRYYDKSRMEINDPKADPASPWYVTNGLLPVELLTGRLQTGNTSYEQRTPAAITAVGDPGQFPTYADLAPLYGSPGALDPGDQNRPAARLLNADGSIGRFDDYASDPATLLIAQNNDYRVPRAFSDVMSQRGPIWQGGRTASGPVYDPLFVFGLPITAPHWVKVRVGGRVLPILFQVFERRVLTYNPANPPGFRVEMGNVGLHYFQWRYSTSQP